MKFFSLEELSQFNGKNGCQAYVAYKGKVYDVTESFLWKNGSHQVLHEAGVDLTEAMAQSPHGEYVLEKFPIIGQIR